MLSLRYDITKFFLSPSESSELLQDYSRTTLGIRTTGPKMRTKNAECGLYQNKTRTQPEVVRTATRTLEDSPGLSRTLQDSRETRTRTLTRTVTRTVARTEDETKT